MTAGRAPTIGLQGPELARRRRDVRRWRREQREAAQAAEAVEAELLQQTHSEFGDEDIGGSWKQHKQLRRGAKIREGKIGRRRG
eukprot:SAG22_NODE_5300_length_1042_cov_0.863203_2_plen_83_part_01